jgi:predicted nucleotidyltransferase
MTQLHTIYYGVGVVRPTNDVDIVLHIETSRGVPDETARALKSLGYDLRDTFDPRDNTAHRFVRGADVVDLVTSEVDVVDVLIADHSAPSVTERLLGRDMVRIEGGTQALRRTVYAHLEIVPGEVTVVSVPRPFGALVLKAAAYQTDSREPGRHLADAAALLACVEDPIAEREGFVGSDRSRVVTLERELDDDHLAWLALPENKTNDGRAALRLLSQLE